MSLSILRGRLGILGVDFMQGDVRKEKGIVSIDSLLEEQIEEG